MYSYITSMAYSLMEAFCIFGFVLFLGWAIKLALEDPNDKKNEEK